ncbi:unnamed protein product [Fusarium graminearum]|uniref:Chromosome 2, complete genome n=1 Tax=Gibberella zeae (strain ATCC MYA-4620 / CBS 123657 / FGSC 9075 / NRRL 31084 / PH-1) TaxID=229533 RepID=I1S9D2_GIBZE|nr:hypothetical protein FGSG_13463 [Fusarium graminearum PH-1]CAF3466422.1 unnamed protein product [Fusarium graminearum]ESU15417.1 hypothetical protein FGSG_13463 [Fusarium graminearum PH-1]CAF3560918.1 unnamed protein product [Fusarium graminearum]CEF76230.1 unnamed protein product [Fusarium graminearum]CZS79521.1 unnamed protein product [Fusarium graminearum]|eukprot:XP_011320842.1 hypothetical protein FGSG_13463 [Fusarium graminearum PH-1]
MELIEDAQNAIQKAQDVVNTTVNGHSDETRQLSYLTNIHCLRFLYRENLTNLNKSIQITRRVIDSASVAGQDTSTYSSNLTIHLNERFLELRDLNDLEESI